MWTLDDIKKELQDTSNLLKHKRDRSTLTETDIKKLEDSLVVSIEHKLSSMKWNAQHALEFHTVMDSCGSFSSDMSTKLRAKVDTLLVQPVAAPVMQMAVKPQTLSIPAYLTEEEWSCINGTHSYHTKLSTICKRAKALGVQSCSEQTVKSITATLLCGLTALPDAAAMHQVVTDVKLSMSSMTTQAGLPFVLKYPANPLDLAQEVLSAAYGQSNPACKIPDKYTVVLKQVPLRVTHASLSKNKQTGEATPAATPAQAGNSSSSSGCTGVPDMQAFQMCMLSMAMHALQNKKALKTLLDIKTPEKQQEAPPDQSSQQVNKKPAVPALMDEQVAPAINVPAAAVATLQPKLRTQTSTPAVCTLPTNTEEQPVESQSQLDGAEIEEAAFQALKNRTPNAKAKPTAASMKKPSAKVKASIMKRPSASAAYSKSKALAEYQCPLPEDRWMASTKDSWTSKHYHTARQLAVKAGLDDDSAKAYGRDARSKAVLAWDKKFG